MMKFGFFKNKKQNKVYKIHLYGFNCKIKA